MLLAQKILISPNSAAFLPDATGQCDLEFIVSFQKKKISWEMPVKGYFLMRFSFDRLLDFDRKTAYSKWYFSVADRQRRCAVCLGSHFALLGNHIIFTIFLWFWLLYDVLFFSYAQNDWCLFALRFVWHIVWVAATFCFAKRWGYSPHTPGSIFEKLLHQKAFVP